MFETIANMPPALFDAVGVFGFGLYVLNYTMLTFHRVTSHCKSYFAINLVAASMVLIGMTFSFNLASALIQLFWIGISVAAIIVRVRASKGGALSVKPA
ncbi:hypothetical protein SAMN05444287_2015 [Octadecabacter temperatus]|uniref:CBU-0592-like domain-containing protein n=1 Tax=Octadecabacter temperatus TaxID=1458307 RepID=A0A0K0Y7M9_9RHOB|nr:hypothetical protein [Octadecabacter temperatus]AKS46891.1 hypothetical protein OSB_23550 [Octadecabacter temperatus]SIO23184.1 hypothetical protein SAMN05444287_2015 [Octadecabacter temperatus]